MAKLTQQLINAFTCWVVVHERSQYWIQAVIKGSQYQHPDDTNGQTFNEAGQLPVTPFWRYKEAVLWCRIHFLVYFLQKQEHNQHSVHWIRPLSCWQKPGEACQLSTWNTGFLLIHPPPSVALPTVAHQSSHWDNDCEVSWYTLMKCNIL